MPASGPLADKMLSVCVESDGSQPVFLSVQKTDADTAWKMEEISENQIAHGAEYDQLTSKAFAEKEEVFTVDSRELVINGYIREISLFAVDRKMYNVSLLPGLPGIGFGEGWALQMRLKTQRTGGGEEKIQHNGAPNSDNQLFKELSPVYVETAMIFLPDWPIYSLRLSIRRGVKNVLCFEYKPRKESDWVGANPDGSTLTEWQPGYVEVGKEVMKISGPGIASLGLHYEGNKTGNAARIAPKVLTKK